MKNKDALTDLVEHSQDATVPESSTEPSDDRKVVNSSGETVTLGQKPTRDASFSNKSNPLELNVLQETITRALEKAFENVRSRIKSINDGKREEN